MCLVARSQQPIECRYSFLGHRGGFDGGYFVDRRGCRHCDVHHPADLQMVEQQRVQKGAGDPASRRNPDYVSLRLT